MCLPFFVLRLKQGKNSNLNQKWKVGYGGLCENPNHQSKALLAIIFIDIHCIRDIQVIRGHWTHEAAPELNTQTHTFHKKNLKSENSVRGGFKPPFLSQ